MTVAGRPAQPRQPAAAAAARTCRATRAGVLVLVLACAAGTATFAAPGTRQGTARATPDDAGVEHRDDAPAGRAVPGDEVPPRRAVPDGDDDVVPTRRAVPDGDDDAPTRRAVPGDGAPAGRPVSPAAAAPDVAAIATPAPARAPVAVPASNYENQRLRRSKLPAPRPSTTQKSAGAAAAAAGRQATSGFDAARVVTALGIVLALILLLKWFGRRFFAAPGVGRSTRAVQVVSRSPLSPRQQLVLLRVGRRVLVVADGGGQMNTLSEITDPDEVAALLGQLQDDHADRATKSFGGLFGKMRGAFERDEMAASDTADDDDDDGAGRGVGLGRGNDDRDGSDRRPMLGERRFGCDANDDDGPAVESTRQELSGLVDKVRRLSSQFKAP